MFASLVLKANYFYFDAFSVYKNSIPLLALIAL